MSYSSLPMNRLGYMATLEVCGLLEFSVSMSCEHLL